MRMGKTIRQLLVFGGILFSALPAFGQYESIIAPYADSSAYKFVLRTEEKLDDRFVALDNMTIKANGDTCKVYYMHYGDGLVSSVMIPFSVFSNFAAFEKKVINSACEKPECTYSILIEAGEDSLRVPIDILYLEMLSSFMLELER